MKKFLIYSVGTLVVLALVVYLGGQFFLGSIVKAGVNTIAPKITQTTVTLGSATISPISGSGTLNNLVVGNPKGWSDTPLCSLGTVHLDIVPSSIVGDHVVINEIIIDAPEFNYETKLVASNVSDLLKNIEQSLGGASKAEEPTAKNGQPMKFEVKKFILKNGKVRLGVGVAAMSLPMPPIELNDLGTKEGGITAGQLVFAVMRSVTGSVVTATTQAVGKIGSTTGAAAAEGVKKTGEAIKGLFEKKP